MRLRWAQARYVKEEVRIDAGFAKPLVLPTPHECSCGHPCMGFSCAALLLHNTLTSSGGSSTATEKSVRATKVGLAQGAKAGLR